MPPQRRIRSLEEYIERVESIYAGSGFNPADLPWFRGQHRADWSLVPSLYRCSIDPLWERALTRDFHLRARPLVDILPTSDLEWMMVMQHYDLPTRLLDWTESSLCALYFAVENHRDAADAAVWILDPWLLNEKSIGRRSVPPADDKVFRSYAIDRGEDGLGTTIAAMRPAALRAIHTTRRIIAQRGTFSVHGSLHDGIDELAIRNKELWKIVIDGKRRLEILNQLYMAGITRATLFGDLSGLSAELVFRYSQLT